MLNTNYELNKNEFSKEFKCIVQELDWTNESQRELTFFSSGLFLKKIKKILVKLIKDKDN